MIIVTNDLYTTSEVAALLKVSIVTIKRYIAQNKIPSIKFNGIRRIKGEDILKILSSENENEKSISNI